MIFAVRLLPCIDESAHSHFRQRILTKQNLKIRFPRIPFIQNCPFWVKMNGAWVGFSWVSYKDGSPTDFRAFGVRFWMAADAPSSVAVLRRVDSPPLRGMVGAAQCLPPPIISRLTNLAFGGVCFAELILHGSPLPFPGWRGRGANRDWRGGNAHYY